MNDITSRFAAMAERVARDEAGVAQGRQEYPGDTGGWRVDASRQQQLDAAVADELASLGRDDPPPPAIDPHDGPLSPKTNDARGRAIAYVSRLIDSYRSMRRDSYSYKVGLTGKIGHLTKELAVIQSAGPEGETLARRWDFIVGDGRGGRYGARSFA